MFTPLASNRLRIRRLTRDDVPSIFTYRSDPEVSRYQNWAPASLEEAERSLEPAFPLTAPAPDQWFQLGICLASSGQLIGDCGLHLLGNGPGQVEVGITLNPLHQKRGYALEAMRMLLSYLFDQLEVHRVFGSVDPRNAASVALLKRAGMRQEAHFIQSYWFKGAWADDLVFALLRGEWADRASEDPGGR
jgi:RimJ/RimL family protein N-acetyltransferase